MALDTEPGSVIKLPPAPLTVVTAFIGQIDTLRTQSRVNVLSDGSWWLYEDGAWVPWFQPMPAVTDGN